MNKLDSFEELLKGSLENHEMPYDANSWAGMEERLNQMPKGGSSAGFKSGTIFTAAAVTAGLIIGGAFLFQDDTPETIDSVSTEFTPVAYKPNTDNLNFIDAASSSQSVTPTENTSADTNHNNHDLASNTPSVNNPDQNDPNVSQGGSNDGSNDENVTGQPDQVQPSDAVTNDNSGSDIADNSETAQSALPDFDLNGNANESCAGTVVAFDAGVTNFNGNYFWDFGDGSVSNAKSPTHRYQDGGDYVVSLTLGNEKDGLTKEHSIHIFDAPQPDFRWEQSKVGSEPDVEFTNYSNSSLDYTWDFGNGESSNEESPSYRLRKGNHKVTLTATNEYGCVSTHSQMVRIKHSYNLFAPTGFSPGSDNLNDQWLPAALQVLDVEFKITILDRHGKVVFVTTEVNRPWDGRDLNGNVRYGETFVWICEVVNPEDGEIESYQGPITLTPR